MEVSDYALTALYKCTQYYDPAFQSYSMASRIGDMCVMKMVKRSSTTPLRMIMNGTIWHWIQALATTGGVSGTAPFRDSKKTSPKNQRAMSIGRISTLRKILPQIQTATVRFPGTNSLLIRKCLKRKKALQSELLEDFYFKKNPNAHQLGRKTYPGPNFMLISRVIPQRNNPLPFHPQKTQTQII